MTSCFSRCSCRAAACGCRSSLRSITRPDESRMSPTCPTPTTWRPSSGAARIEFYAAETDELTFLDGACRKVDDFARELAGYQSGHLVQECLRPHPEIASAIGDRVSTI